MAVNIAKAKDSHYHGLYPKLEFNVIRTLINNFKSWCISLTIKARDGMLNLNSRSSYPIRTEQFVSKLCNLKASENILHFIGVCPVYNSIRFQYFGSIHLDINKSKHVYINLIINQFE